MRAINRRILRNKKGLIIVCTAIIFVFLLVFTLLYFFQSDVREWIDLNVLRKDLTDEDTEIISLNTDKSNQIHVYGKNIMILNDKTVDLYNSYGEKIQSINVNINNAIFDSKDKYLAIAEKEGHEICLFLDKNYLWNANIEGEILQIHVNQNGYVVVVARDATHKSIVTTYNSEGKKLFTSYFSSTRIIDASISSNNKYVAIGELDTSGTIIKSVVKVISVENAQKNPEKTIIYSYEAEEGDLITNIEYQYKGQIVCTYDNSISVINNEQNQKILEIGNEKITYVASGLKNHIVYIEEEKSGLFKSESKVNIMNSYDKHIKVYKLDEVAKEMYTRENTIAINVGTEIYFISTNGWLIKKYTASQEITNVEFSDNIATIIYKDKVVIISL